MKTIFTNKVLALLGELLLAVICQQVLLSQTEDNLNLFVFGAVFVVDIFFVYSSTRSIQLGQGNLLLATAAGLVTVVANGYKLLFQFYDPPLLASHVAARVFMMVVGLVILQAILFTILQPLPAPPPPAKKKPK